MFSLEQAFKESFTITEEVYLGFIKIFKDSNPLHTKVDFARKKGFKDKVMHGNILNGFISYFIGECLSTKDVMIISQTISYHAPIYLNDVVEFNAILSDYSEAVNSYTFKYKFSIQEKRVAKGKVQIKLL